MEEDEGWITIKGTHIYINKGESVPEAFERTTGKKIDSVLDQNSREYKEIMDGKYDRGSMSDKIRKMHDIQKIKHYNRNNYENKIVNLITKSTNEIPKNRLINEQTAEEIILLAKRYVNHIRDESKHKEKLLSQDNIRNAVYYPKKILISKDKSGKESIAFISKEYENKHRIVCYVKPNEKTEDVYNKNVILTYHIIDEKRYNTLIENNELIFSED